MTNLQIEERPGQTTSGLTSANQVVNTTDAVSFDLSNTSSVAVEIGYEILKPEKDTEFESPRDKFQKALRNSFRRDKEALDILEKL